MRSSIEAKVSRTSDEQSRSSSVLVLFVSSISYLAYGVCSLGLSLWRLGGLQESAESIAKLSSGIGLMGYILGSLGRRCSCATDMLFLEWVEPAGALSLCVESRRTRF